MLPVFAQLWSVAFLLHQAEDWGHVGATVIAMLLALWVNRRHDRVLPFATALTFYCGYTFWRLPSVANHSNYFLAVSAWVLLWIGVSALRKGTFRFALLEQAFLTFRGALCASLAVLYFMAGFHKLNRDFFQPEVSCAVDFLLRYASEYHFSEKVFPEWLLAIAPYPVVGVELLGGLFLLYPRTQVMGILAFVGLHTFLAPLSFYDFACVCYAVLVCFLPVSVFTAAGNRARLQRGLNVLLSTSIAGAVVARWSSDYDLPLPIRPDVAQAWFFLVGSGYMIAQVAACVRAGDVGSIWQLGSAPISKPFGWMLLPLLLLLFTSTSYLGLRTAGNASMFSNLRTEGGVSNHLLISSAWQPFSYQQDIVFVEEIAPEHEDLYRRMPQNHMVLAAFELRRIARYWRRKGMTVPMKIRYRGKHLSYDNIADEAMWADSGPRWLEHKFMLFREIQPTPPETPNRCRW